MDPTVGTIVSVRESLADQILNDIYKSLTKQANYERTSSSHINDSLDSISRSNQTGQSNTTKNNKAQQKALKGITSGLNTGNKNRAIQNALLGRIENSSRKQIDLLGKLKSTFSSIMSPVVDHLKNGFKKSLDSFDRLATVMRKANLSSAEKTRAASKSNQALLVAEKLYGQNLAKDEITDAVEGLIGMNKNLDSYAENQIASIAMLQKVGFSIQEAADLGTALSTKQIQKLVNSKEGADPRTMALIQETFRKLSEADIAAGGGRFAVLESIAKQAGNVQSQMGTSASIDAMADIVVANQKVISGSLNTLTDEQMATINALKLGTKDSLDSIGDKMVNLAKDNTIMRAGVIPENVLKSAAITNDAQSVGNQTSQKIRDVGESMEARSINPRDGIIQAKLDRIIAQLDEMTGGMISKFTNWLHEMFGDNVSVAAGLIAGGSLIKSLGGIIFTPIRWLGSLLSKGLGAAIKRIGPNLLNGLQKLGPKLLSGFGKFFTKFLGPVGAIATAATVGFKVGEVIANNIFPDVMQSIREAGGYLVALQEMWLNLKYDVLLPLWDHIVGFYDVCVGWFASAIETIVNSFNFAVDWVKITIERLESIGGFINTLTPFFELKFAELSNTLYDKVASPLLYLLKPIYQIIYDFIKPVLGFADNIYNTILELVAEFKDSAFGSGFKDDKGKVISKKEWLESNRSDLVNSSSFYSPDAVFKKLDEAIKPTADIAKLEEDFYKSGEKLRASEQRYEDKLADLTSRKIIAENKAMSVSDYVNKKEIERLNDRNKEFSDLAAKKEANRAEYKAKQEQEKLAETESKLENPIENINEYLSSSNISSSLNTLTNSLPSVLQDILQTVKKLVDLPKFGKGGETSGPSMAGEAGKEAIIPVSSDSAAKKAFSKLSGSVKGILSKLVESKNMTIPSGGAPGDDEDSIEKLLSFANKADAPILRAKIIEGMKKRLGWYNESLANAGSTEGRDLVKGTYAERALAYGVHELGKPYLLRSIGKLGYVCNELTDAALRNSGFDMQGLRLHQVSATFNKLKSGKLNKDGLPTFRLRPDINIDNALPGMVFFQTSKGKDQPGHIGLVYYGKQRLHSSGGAKDFLSKEGFLSSWTIPSRGVTVNGFDKSAHYDFAEFPGLFAKADGSYPDWMKSDIAESTSATGEAKLSSAGSGIHSNYDAMIKGYEDALSVRDDYTNYLSDPYKLLESLSDTDNLDENVQAMKAKSLNGFTAARKAAKGGDLYNIKKATDPVFERLGTLSTDEVISKLSDIASILRTMAIQRRNSIATKPAANNFSA